MQQLYMSTGSKDTWVTNQSEIVSAVSVSGSLVSKQHYYKNQ